MFDRFPGFGIASFLSHSEELHLDAVSWKTSLCAMLNVVTEGWALEQPCVGV